MKDDYKWIDEYLNGGLSDEERTNFEVRLRNDPVFKEAYEVKKSMDIFLKTRKEKTSLIKDIDSLGEKYFRESENDKPKGKVAKMMPRWVRYASAAAAVLILVIAIRNSLPPKSLYDQYADIGKMALEQKGPETFIGKAEASFNAQDYISSYDFLIQHLNNEPEDIQAYYYLGLSALESGNYEEALRVFEKLNQGTTAFQKYGKWWQAMTYLKMKNFNQCRKALEEIPESNDTFFEKAQELLVKINKR